MFAGTGATSERSSAAFAGVAAATSSCYEAITDNYIMIPAPTPSKHNPFLSPAWRWERAAWLRGGGRYSRSGDDDDYTRLARDYQKSMQRSRTNRGRDRVRQRYPGIYWAEEVYEASLPEQRWTMEAFLLSNENRDAIAHFVHSSQECIFWYEKLFFNVTPYLDHEGYIVNTVLRNSVHYGLAERDYDLLWKLIGYTMGPLALKQLIVPFVRLPVYSSTDMKKALEAQADTQLARKMLLAARSVPLWNNHRVVFEAYSRMRELEKNAENALEGEVLILQNIQEALKELPLQSGQAVALSSDQSAAEPRAAELIGLNGPANAESWSYPAPKKEPTS